MKEYASPPMATRKHKPEKFPEGTFPDAVKALRAASGMTQSDFARALDMPRRETLADWEQGNRTPPPAVQRERIGQMRKLARKRNPA